MSYNYYPLATTGLELDMRGEFNRLVEGDPDEPGMIPHGAWVILRKLQKDAQGNGIKGFEVDPVTKEPDMVFKSDNVTETGFLYNDHLTRGYIIEIRLSSLTEFQSKPGIVNDNLRVIYLKQSAKPEIHDLLLVPEIDDDGNVKSPVKIYNKFYITNVLPAYSDGQRIDFYRCMLEAQR